MRDQIIKSVENIKDEMVNSIIESVQIPSVIGEESKQYPFGKDIDDVLNHMLDLCDKLGFKIYKDKEGYYGYAEIGEGEELVGILGHLDVVPAGDLSAWNVEPFKGTIIDGKLYGRGTQDDKGPTIAAIYATKAIIDSGFKLNKRVRFIFGTDEETLWRDMAKYNENKEEIPSFGFTPDSAFPCINAEKGLLQCILSSNKASKVNLKAGDAFNAVPSKATYNSINLVELESELKKLGFEYKKEENAITVIGKSVHSQKCNEGINSISRICIALKNIGINTPAIDFISEVIKEDAHANYILPNCEDVSGKLTLNLGKIDLNEDGEKIYLDVRIPVTVEKDEFVNALREKANKYGLDYIEYDWLKSIYIPSDHFLIKTLRKVYEQETNCDSTPMASGGATYARAIDNCVAFGAIFPWGKKTEHQPNEYVEIKDIIKATEIYALTLYELTR
ncbi:M20 family metallopeptidase [Paraclostridium bifermentans]|jgi:succinyl-diaminopimelate desuccinylase|uniref:M20 family metallopeptidase n=1 Tax=Paraclostridium bifermentans TaxID=1490 RepID=UPI000DF7A20F|nr:M20 family metallopeptidase [Paraclostridium bifermentans]RDC50909.1 M20/M25/M40 family metallo-hydrolase [Acinetobacter sp. RIT592]